MCMKTMRYADLHVHSNLSHDVPELESLSPRALFEKALGNADQGRRMDYFCLTDHETMEGYQRLVHRLPEADRALVIPGVEHALLDPQIGFTIHVNLFMIDPDTYSHLREAVITLDELVCFCRQYDVLTQYNHPTWFEQIELRHGRVRFSKLIHIARLFDVLELNAGRSHSLNRATAVLAHSLGKVLTSNSDSHSGDIGLACNCAMGDTAGAFVRNVWSGQGSIRASDVTYESMLKVVHHFIDSVIADPRGIAVLGSMLPGQCPLLEDALMRLINARWLHRRPPGREMLRLLLKQTSRPVVSRWIRQQHALAQRLSADAVLGAFLSPMARVKAA